MTLDLPEPPSVNRMWARGRGKRLYLTDAGRSYKELVAVLARNQMREQRAKTIRGQDAEMAVFWFRRRKVGDATNRQKALEDALNTIAYDDDKQLARVHNYRIDGVTRGRVLVVVRPCEALTEDEARVIWEEAA